MRCSKLVLVKNTYNTSRDSKLLKSGTGPSKAFPSRSLHDVVVDHIFGIILNCLKIVIFLDKVSKLYLTFEQAHQDC